MTIFEFTARYVEWSRGVHAVSTTQATYLALRRFAHRVGWDTPLDAVEPGQVDQFMSNLRQGGLMASSVNNYHRHLKAAFNKAISWGHLADNPFCKVRPIRQERQLPKFIPPDEIPVFLAGITDERRRLLITGYISTGRRRCELLGLRWGDVNRKTGMYRVQTVKTHHERMFPINDAFASVLDRLPVASDQNVWVFPWWRNPDTVTHMVKRELVRGGYPGLHLHHLRHTFASLYLMCGGDLFALRELLGHASINMTMIYSHLTGQHLAREANRINLGVAA